MAGISRVLADDILQNVYGEQVYDQLNNETRTLNRIQRGEPTRWAGRQAIEALRIGRNHGSKAVDENGLLPTAGYQQYDNLVIPMKRIYGSIQVTGPVMAESKDAGAFTDATAAEIEGLVKDMLEDQERMMWGDGRGVLALVNDSSGGAVTSLVIDSPGGVAGSINGARYISENMVLGFYDTSGGTLNAVRTVSAISADGTTLTLPSINNTTEAPNNGIITRGVSRSGSIEGSFGLEPMGLLGIIDNGTYVTPFHGIDRTAVLEFNSKVFTNVGVIDELIFERAMNYCDEVAGAAPDWMAAHHSVHTAYYSHLLPDRRFSGAAANRPDGGILGGGKKRELTWSDQPIEKHRYCPYGKLYGIDSSVIRRYESEKGKWIDEDGAILRKVADIDAFEAHYRQFVNYSAMQCNTSFVLDGITATVDVVGRR